VTCAPLIVVSPVARSAAFPLDSTLAVELALRVAAPPDATVASVSPLTSTTAPRTVTPAPVSVSVAWLGPVIVTPLSATLNVYCPFGLVNVPEKESPLQTYAVEPAASVIAAPPAAQCELPAASGVTVGLIPLVPVWSNVISVSTLVLTRTSGGGNLAAGPRVVAPEGRQ
jgi:hypothetical protein